MTLLILGLAIFFGVHLLSVSSGLKLRLIHAVGEKTYKVMYSILAGIGLALIVTGYAGAPRGHMLFSPSQTAIMLAPFAMILSFILLAAAYMKTHIRARLKHPMLLGVGIWSLVHLLTNGDVRATLLFGAFLLYVALDLMSVVRRNSIKSFEPMFRHDVIAVVSGVLLALLVMTFHRQLMGVAVVSWDK